MRVKTILDEDFINYKKASMFIFTCFCNFKCCADASVDPKICQNQMWINEPIHFIKNEDIVDRYKQNFITSAIVFGGLEPFDQFEEVIGLISMLREVTKDDIVIYTGYNKDEISEYIDQLKQYKNIIIKFGRYIPNSESVFDPILGVKLVSNNQYAEKIS